MSLFEPSTLTILTEGGTWTLILTILTEGGTWTLILTILTEGGTCEDPYPDRGSRTGMQPRSSRRTVRRLNDDS